MRIQKQGGVIPRLHPHSGWNQTWEKSTESNKGRQTTHRYQDHPVFCRLVQLLQDAHQRLRSHRRSAIQIDEQGFRLQIRTTSRESLESFLHPAETAHLRTGNGLPKIRSPICLDHRCSHWNGGHSRGPGGHMDPSGPRRKLSCHLLRIQTAQGPQNELFTFPIGSRCRCVGDGLLQRIPQGQKIHLIHGSQAIGETWSLAQ